MVDLAVGMLSAPMPVIFEVLSSPGLTKEAQQFILRLPNLEISSGYWERAGKLRRGLLQKGLKARSMDCLIAQNCIDYNVALIAADRDFGHFVKAGLRLVDTKA